MSKFVYFMRPVGMTTPVKIGCSDMPMQRLAALSCWSPFPLEIVATIPGNFVLERNIHACLWDMHSHREWFNDDGRIAAIIDKLLAGVPIHKAMDLSARIRRSANGNHWKQRPETKKRCSYAMRVSWADRKFDTPEHYYTVPDDIKAIVNSWRTYGYGAKGRVPTAEDYAKLDAFLADPLPRMTRHERSPMRKAA
jgi:hypothetical protein